MNEYVITFKYDNEGYMRHIVADCEDDAVGIAFARTRGMLKEFDAKNVTSLDVKEIGKKEIRAASRLTFSAEVGNDGWDEGEGPPPTPPVPVSRNPGQSPYPATMTPDEYSNRNLGTSTAPINPPAVQISAQEARRLHDEGGLWYNSGAFVLGYQFYYRGQIHIITSGGNEVAEQNTTPYTTSIGTFNRATQEQYRSYQDQIDARITSITPAPTGQTQMSVPNNSGIFNRFIRRLDNAPAWTPTPINLEPQPGSPRAG